MDYSEYFEIDIHIGDIHYQTFNLILCFLERALRPNRMYWRQGIYLNWSPEAYCLVESAVFDNNPDSFLKITAPSCRKG